MPDMIKRRRNVQTIELGQEQDSIFGNVNSTVNYGQSVIRTVNRLLLNQGHKGPPFKEGGPFQTSTVDIKFYPAVMDENFVYFPPFDWKFTARGNFIPNIGQANGEFLGLNADFARTVAKGSIGYERYRPGSTDASVAQFLGELKEVPTVLSTFKHVAASLKNRKSYYMKDFRRMIAGDYLNLMFGWIPALTDIRKVVTTTYNKSKTLTQLARDNGKPIRRRGPISSDSASETIVTTGSGFPPDLMPPINAIHFVGNWKKTVTIQVQERYWFSARFRYYIPDFGSLAWSKRTIARLYGLNPSPELVWNLIPWSWAIDWFTNIGSTMSNFSPNLAENLVSDYAYVMEHRSIITTTRIDFVTRSGPKSCSVVHKQESKYRLPASPFGFGVTWDGLSPRQLAILLALGISRVR